MYSHVVEELYYIPDIYIFICPYSFMMKFDAVRSFASIPRRVIARCRFFWRLFSDNALLPQGYILLDFWKIVLGEAREGCESSQVNRPLNVYEGSFCN